MKRKTKSPEERFWKKVDKNGPNGCWVWTASTAHCGYGQFALTPLGNRPRAHRYSWELVNGPIPQGMRVCHKCDNPPCVNPDHLFLGTARDNTLDAMAKGRLKWPDARLRPGNAKITPEIALEIKHATGFQREIAEKYGVSKSSVGQIKTGVQWKYLP